MTLLTRAGRMLAAGIVASTLTATAAPAQVPRIEGPHQEVPLEQAIQEGVDWLVANQRENGAWGSHHSPRPIEVFCSVPGSHRAFRLATTGLCLIALLHSPYQTEASAQAFEKGLNYMMADMNVKRMSGLEHYTVWGFGYMLRAMGETLLAKPDHPRAEEMRKACDFLIEKLGRYQSLDGGWGYLSIIGLKSYQPAASSMSFTTASILIGLHRVQEAGVKVPETMVDRALKAVARCRLPDGGWTYGEMWNANPIMGINRPKGSACRAPTCHLALDLFGRRLGAPDEEKRILDDLLIRYARFQTVSLRRPIPHESWYQISGYFFLYGHSYAGLLLDREDPEDARRHATLLEKAIYQTRQPDGSFWDYPLYSYHKPYGTAYALIALEEIADLRARSKRVEQL
ncbi:MAG: hypothetical protein DWQ01_11135 [Planctomycetota bacterium]|nr:MAG: hypothetical protein DWQ01_11135 [Planctomycetota bacterium]